MHNSRLFMYHSRLEDYPSKKSQMSVTLRHNLSKFASLSMLWIWPELQLWALEIHVDLCVHVSWNASFS